MLQAASHHRTNGKGSSSTRRCWEVPSLRRDPRGVRHPRPNRLQMIIHPRYQVRIDSSIIHLSTRSLHVYRLDRDSIRRVYYIFVTWKPHARTRTHTVWMTSSWEGKARWPGVVLGKIKSLWSSSQGTANDGLNQLIGSSNKIAGRETLLESDVYCYWDTFEMLGVCKWMRGSLKNRHARVETRANTSLRMALLVVPLLFSQHDVIQCAFVNFCRSFLLRLLLAIVLAGLSSLINRQTASL